MKNPSLVPSSRLLVSLVKESRDLDKLVPPVAWRGAYVMLIAPAIALHPLAVVLVLAFLVVWLAAVARLWRACIEVSEIAIELRRRLAAGGEMPEDGEHSRSNQHPARPSVS